jgi:ABC-type polysaccharide/polyol phosphate export permease
MGHAIFKRTQRRLRIFTSLVMTFLLFFSGVFYPMSEILQMPFTGFMNHFNFGDPVLYADYD